MVKKDDLLQIRLSGFGGQGVVMMGYILGKAAAIYEGKNATMSQSYGPESRGGASACDVLISSNEIDYPKVTEPQVIVVLSQDAYLTYGRKRPETAILIVEEELVELSEEDEKLAQGRPDAGAEKIGRKVFTIPATRIAEGLGRKIVANMVMLGYMAAVSSCVSIEALKQAIATSVPKGTEKLNLSAFEAGYTYAQKVLETEKEKAAV